MIKKVAAVIFLVSGCGQSLLADGGCMGRTSPTFDLSEEIKVLEERLRRIRISNEGEVGFVKDADLLNFCRRILGNVALPGKMSLREELQMFFNERLKRLSSMASSVQRPFSPVNFSSTYYPHYTNGCPSDHR